ncbi:MAG: hypothetical protein JJ934_13540 [Pseudomonadales bacterium]|nr:hypothetical protein [Pseudomonadales bacterium]MBO6563843.1 hypothetical protein [Pseudomonadales bacterium]MBO6596983.1 hypothetical protein [Pseudomonadales bacterium]MBO6657918.1 hypothetical protein [Pseudomonadales bacterium]MBO6703625.1 hypothetical protein [Pseudomonadales bacterium]
MSGQINRRELLRAGIATGAAATLSSGLALADRSKSSISSQMESLEARFDKLEHHHKNLVRAGAVAFAFSTGIDVLAFF